MTSSYLVTGAAGFIGFHLCEALMAEGHYVLGVDNLNSYYDTQLKRDRLARLGDRSQFMFIRLDLSERRAVEELFENAQFDGVFHMAAQAGVRYSLENPHAYVDSNLVAFVNILEGCRLSHLNRLIYASSSSVYGDNAKLPFSVDDSVDRPISLYAATKRSNELLAYAYSHLYGMRITGLRFFTVYGPWGRPDMAVYKFTRAMLSGLPIDLFNHGQMKRDFTYIDDIIAGIIQAERQAKNAADSVSSESRCRLYNLGNNRPVQLESLIATLEECLGVKAQLRYSDQQPGEVRETYADITSSSRELNFAPRISLREGIERFVDWYRDYHREPVPKSKQAVIN